MSPRPLLYHIRLPEYDPSAVGVTETPFLAAIPRLRMARPRSAQARTEILHIRLTADERGRLKAASESEYLDQSAWARRALLQALDAWEESGRLSRRPTPS